ncbi:MAG: FN3 domain-containing metallophosphoesterase family protein [Pseudomonadota bacterium]
MSLRVILAGFSTLLMTVAAQAHPIGHSEPLPPWQAATSWPDRVIATLSGDPATEFSATWRTDISVGRTIIQIAEATADTRFDLGAETYRAKTESVDLETFRVSDGAMESLENVGLGKAHYHSYTFTGLKPDTLYAWRVQGGRGHWSEWYQTRTASTSGPISFVYFGDAQNGVRPTWSRVIRAAFQTEPYAAFFLHAGDLVQKGDSDYNWAEWFEAGGFIHAMIPVVPVPGNHENITVFSEGPSPKRTRVRTPLWRPQFTLPVDKSLPDHLQESNYDLRYSDDLHLFVIDSAQDTFDAQATWLDEKLSNSTAKWRIVTMHHPYFLPESFDRNRDDAARRAALSSVIDKHEVDLVLTGHVHTYGRASLPETQQTARRALGDANAVRTVFVISSSGAKNTDIWSADRVEQSVGDGATDLGDLSLDRVAGNTPMFQVLRINGDVLSYEARTAIGDIYDAFQLRKTVTGQKQLTQGAPAFGETRLFSNTGPYREWWDLR